MKISITNTSELNIFAQKIADVTGKKIPTNSLKSAMAKAYNYNHITALNTALDKDSLEMSNDINLVQSIITSYREDTGKHVLKLTKLESVDDLSSMNKDDAEDSIFKGAEMILESDNLAKAVVLLKNSGMEDIANLLLLTATSSADYDFISEQM
jgi:hypothetical protein